MISVSVNKCGFAVIDTSRYGMSPVLAGRIIQAKVFFDHIKSYHDRQLADNYPRSYGKGEEIYLEAVH